MTYNSKKAVMRMLVSAIVVICYVVYALGGNAPLSNDLAAWALRLLTYVGISIVGHIIAAIIFEIVMVIGITIKEETRDEGVIKRIVKSVTKVDERDKLIELKSSQVGFICCGGGVLLMLVMLAADLPTIWALHGLVATGYLGSLLEGLLKINYYERGLN